MVAEIGLALSETEVFAPPDGAPVGVTLIVRNDGALVDEVRLHVEGLDPAWVRLSSDSLRLLPGSQTDVHLEVQVPAGAPAGWSPFRVIATTHSGALEPT